MKRAFRTVRRASKLVLWYQFLRQGMLALLVRFYGGVWLATVTVVALSLAMLFSKSDLGTRAGVPWLGTPVLAILLCVVTMAATYLLSRVIGPMLAVAIGVVGPAILIITPTIVMSSPAEPGDGTTALSTGDFGLLMKGIGVCGCLTALTYLVYRLAQVPCSVLGFGRMSFRRVMTWVVVIVSLVALELMRIVIGLWPSFRPPWQSLIQTVLSEPGWPYALAIWLWINLGTLWANYDDRLIPYLLHRIGHTWAPNHLGVQETYMVDSLLAILGQQSRGSGSSRSRRRSDSSRRS